MRRVDPAAGRSIRPGHLGTPSPPRRAWRKTPEVGPWFWVAKGLSTALGEATSDFLVHAINPVVAVLVGFVAFCAALGLQLSRRRYRTWPYWLAVAMVGIFGTMAADVVHVALGVPYAGSSVLYVAALAVVLVSWRRREGTISPHDVDTPRRERWYWATVCATFAAGTAVGDLTASTFGLGYLTSVGLFAGLMVVVVAVGRAGVLGPVGAFWAAYVLTRPLGASVADALGKPTVASGLGFGDGPVAAVLAVAMVAVVIHLARTHKDRPAPPASRSQHPGPPQPAHDEPTRLLPAVSAAPAAQQPTPTEENP